jgi:hypothetical protein
MWSASHGGIDVAAPAHTPVCAAATEAAVVSASAPMAAATSRADEKSVL